jgi:hypothetical protein
MSIGPLIARCCQASILCLQWHDGSDHFVGAGRGCGEGVIAGDERIANRDRLRPVSLTGQLDRVDVAAGVMVLSEVAGASC